MATVQFFYTCLVNELDPDVEAVARAHFSFLEASRASVRVIPGDARLSLAARTGERYGLIVSDVFAGGSIPLHLVTREALGLYLDRLEPDGVILFHISNRFLTIVENVAFGLRLSEYHTGLRAYSRQLLETIPYDANSDDFVFDQELIAQVVAAGMRGRIGEIAVPTRYFEEASSVGFRRSVVYGLSTLRVVARYLLHRLRVRPSRKLRARRRAE